MVEQGARAIEVTGVGRVAVVPDRVTVHLGVESVATTPGRALRTVAGHASRLAGLLDRRSIPSEDRQARRLDVGPAYDRRRQQTSGHQAAYQLSVKVQDMEIAGVVVDEAAAAVGTDLRIGGLSWSLADPTSAMALARRRAVTSAWEQAHQLAAGLQVNVGPVREVVEQDQRPQGVVTPDVGSPPGASGASTAGVALVRPGIQEVTCVVRVVFELLNGDGAPDPAHPRAAAAVAV